MSGKRGAGDQITRENFRESDDEDCEGPVQPLRASADVIAKRKILKPRSRLGKIGSTGTSAPSSGFNFGAPAAASSEAKPNAFAGFGGFGKPADSTPAPAPAFTFGQPTQKTDTADEPPKANPFGFLKTSTTTEEPKQDNSKAQSVLSFINNNGNGNSNTSSTSLVSTKNTDKASKIKALNDTFYNKITQEKQANPVSNFTPILRKYIDYYDQIDRDIDIPDADTETQEPEQQKALPAAPSFNFGQSSQPAFSFGQANKSAESAAIEAPKETTKEEAIVVDSDSDSDSDDDIKVEGPTFTLAKPPTTTDSVFKLSSAPTTTAASSATGPSFTFAGASKKFDSPFKLTKPVEKKEEEKKEEPKADTPKASFGASNNFTWSPGQPIAFGNDKKDEEKPTAKFNFGSTPSKPADAPAFTFGSKPSESTEEKMEDKPSFNFGNSTTSGFNFGTKPTETIEEKKDDEKKPAFTFGSSSSSGFNFGSTSSGDKPSFSFGSTDSTSKPAFNFGGASAAPAMGSSSFNFNFSGSKPAESKTSGDADDDAVPDEEADVNFKPVTELKEKVEEKTGEEDEEATFTQRAKLMLFVPDNKENPYASKGLGELKVLKNNQTGKYRILVRADGSNRPILNIAVAKQFQYTGMGKGLVKVPTVGADGKLETYMVKVKTEADARNLIKSLTDAQK